MDQSSPKQPRGVPVERGIISGDNVQFGKMRRRNRQSQSESSGPEEEGVGSYGRSPVLQGLQAEQVWYNRSGHEHAESTYYRQRTFSGNRALGSSPRSPNVRSYHAKQNQNQDPSHQSPITVRSSGTRQDSKGRNRTSSETEGGGKGGRGHFPRKRGFSETDNKAKRDNTIMSGLQCLASENIWFDKPRYDDAERRFYEGQNGVTPQPQQQQQQAKSALQQAKGKPKRQHRNSSSQAAGDQELISRMKSLEVENSSLHKVVHDLRAALQKLESRVATLEKSPAAAPCAKAAPVQQKVANGAKAEEEEDDDDIDLFGSDEDDEEAERIKQERLDAYAAKKAKKPALIAKSSIILDVKPWDDETDMAKMEEHVRSIQMDGLLWGASKLVPVGYGIKKLQINCVVEDDKVGTDILEEEITKFEDLVQSVDVAAFNKI
uniref:Eukaryotic translation elongation factor 1 delta a (guanine nucleotide exchange protein) n=1 Tax=Neogobius melanostomus TaxID=47308 RepID=A0A8C6UUB4_9GOBI